MDGARIENMLWTIGQKKSVPLGEFLRARQIFIGEFFLFVVGGLK